MIQSGSLWGLLLAKTNRSLLEQRLLRSRVSRITHSHLLPATCFSDPGQPICNRSCTPVTAASHHYLPHNIIVVKNPSNSKATAFTLVRGACHFSYTLNTQLFVAFARRWNKHFNSNVTPDRRAACAADECSVERNIVGKTTFRELATIIPVKDYGKM